MKQVNPAQYRLIANQFMNSGQQGNNGTIAGALNSALAGFLAGKNYGGANKIENAENAKIALLANKVATPGLPSGQYGPPTLDQTPAGLEANKQQFVSALAGSTDPSLRNAGIAQLLAKPEKPEQYTLGPGQKRFDATGNVLAEGVPQELNPYQAENLALRRMQIDAQNQARQDNLALRQDQMETNKDIRQTAKEDREIKQNENYVQKLSTQADKSGLTELVSSIKDLDALLPTDGSDVPGYGATALTPDVLTTEKGKNIRQRVANVSNALLKARSGGAVTPQEFDRAKAELGIGGGKDDQQLIQGIKNVKEMMHNKLRTIEAGYNPNIVQSFRDRGGISSDVFKPVVTKKEAAGQVPAPAQRVVGESYNTPKGSMIWTGTGWQPAN